MLYFKKSPLKLLNQILVFYSFNINVISLGKSNMQIKGWGILTEMNLVLLHSKLMAKQICRVLVFPCVFLGARLSTPLCHSSTLTAAKNNQVLQCRITCFQSYQIYGSSKGILCWKILPLMWRRMHGDLAALQVIWQVHPVRSAGHALEDGSGTTWCQSQMPVRKT